MITASVMLFSCTIITMLRYTDITGLSPNSMLRLIIDWVKYDAHQRRMASSSNRAVTHDLTASNTSSARMTVGNNTIVVISLTDSWGGVDEIQCGGGQRKQEYKPKERPSPKAQMCRHYTGSKSTHRHVYALTATMDKF